MNKYALLWCLLQNTWRLEGAAAEFAAPMHAIPCACTTAPAQVVAQGVIQQNGGIRQGAYGPRVEFATGMQFTIRDPKRQRVSPRSMAAYSNGLCQTSCAGSMPAALRARLHASCGAASHHVPCQGALMRSKGQC